MDWHISRLKIKPRQGLQMSVENIYQTASWVSFKLMDKVNLPPLNFPQDCLESKLICNCVLFSPQTGLRLCFGNKHLSDSMRDTSCLWFQTKAAPELWMVVSSGWGFLGKRRGCWHRLSGAEGSPHRVPVGAPPGKVRDRHTKQETFERQSSV